MGPPYYLKTIIVTVTDIIAYYYHNSKQIFIYFAGSIFYRVKNITR